MSICILNNHRTKVVWDVYIKYDVNHIADKKVFFAGFKLHQSNKLPACMGKTSLNPSNFS